MDFLRDLFFFIPPLYFLEEGISLCSSLTSSWVPGWEFEVVYGFIKLDHYPPGVFNFGRKVYKCNSRFNFLKVTSEECRGLRTSELAGAERKRCGMWPLLALESSPGTYSSQHPGQFLGLSGLRASVVQGMYQFLDGQCQS